MPFVEIRTTRNSILSYAEHFHSGISLGLITGGKTCLNIDGERYIVEKGDLVLIAPGQVHSCNPVNGRPRDYHMLIIDDRWCVEHFGRYFKTEKTLRVPRPVVRDVEIYAEAIRLVKALLCGSMTQRMQKNFEAFISKLLRTYAVSEYSNHKNDDKYLSLLNIAHGPEQGYAMGNDLSVSTLARSAGVRRESFSRYIRRLTGLSPQLYLHCLRLEKGRRFLREGKTIAEAAFASGYADQSHFHRMFLRFYSVTPGCYRKNRSHLFKK